jgi:hypothetical protein
VFEFTLLQNSRCFEQLQALFKDLFNVFCQGNKKIFFEESIIKISNQLYKRNFTLDLKKIQRLEQIIFAQKSSKMNKENSKYKIRFDSIYNNDIRIEINPLYFPELFKILLDYM